MYTCVCVYIYIYTYIHIYIYTYIHLCTGVLYTTILVYIMVQEDDHVAVGRVAAVLRPTVSVIIVIILYIYIDR